MNLLQTILDHHEDEEILKADGFDQAVIGIGQAFGDNSRLIYSVKKCLEILVGQGMNYEDAVEHFEFNVSGAYVGERTPIWCYDDYEV